MAVIKKLCNVNITSLLTSHHRNIVSKRFNGLNTRQLSNFPSFSTNDSEGKCEYLILHLKASTKTNDQTVQKLTATIHLF